MTAFATTKMTSKGQVVIPEGIRRKLSLKAGSHFIVLGEDDVVILKNISPPAMRDFDALLRAARRQARRAGMRRSDIAAAVKKVRGGT